MSSDAVIEGVAGSLGAVTALVATYPLLTINTQQSAGKHSQDRDSKEQLGRETEQPLLHRIVQARFFVEGWQGHSCTFDCATHSPVLAFAHCSNFVTKLCVGCKVSSPCSPRKDVTNGHNARRDVLACHTEASQLVQSES